jgi:uncharacterized protein YuzE
MVFRYDSHKRGGSILLKATMILRVIMIMSSTCKEVETMAKGAAVTKAVEKIAEAIPYLVGLPAGRVWIDYDQEADVLYVSLRRPQKATDTELLEDEGMLLRYRGKELVGITILEASKRKGTPKKARKG